MQLRTQSLYKTLLKKHSNILLNFSTLEISQDLREYLTEIDIKLANDQGETFYTDSFEWDIISEENKYSRLYSVLKTSAVT